MSIYMKKQMILASFLGVALGLQAQHIPSTIDSVFAPIKVATPPSDAYIGLSKLETGEIRHYNYGEQAVAGNFMATVLLYRIRKMLPVNGSSFKFPDKVLQAGV